MGKQHGVSEQQACALVHEVGDRSSRRFQFPDPESPDPQIWGVRISPLKFGDVTERNTVKQVICEGSPPNLGVFGLQGSESDSGVRIEFATPIVSSQAWVSHSPLCQQSFQFTIGVAANSNHSKFELNSDCSDLKSPETKH